MPPVIRAFGLVLYQGSSYSADYSAAFRENIRGIGTSRVPTSRDNRPLRLDASGPFTYLSSEPGQYIRFTRINDKVAYVEHVDMPLGSVTWWGELEIILRK